MAFSFVLKLFVIISAILGEISPATRDFVGPFALVRFKRSPQRAFTYSGFNPSNGLTALATSADFLPPYYNYQSLSSLTPSQYTYGIQGRKELEPPSSPSSSDYTPDYQPRPSEYPTGESNTEDRSFPSPNLTPPSEQAPTTNYSPNPDQPPKKYNKKKPQIVENEDDDDDDDAKSKSKSTSNASFNAWFPIVLGMYPSHGDANPNVFKEHVENETSKNYYTNRYTDRELGSTVIANSVSHGKSSVASSHAIAYGGEPSMKSYKKG